MIIRWLLDTNACIAVMKNQPPSVKASLLEQAVESVGISAISLYELHYGVSKSSRSTQNAATLANFCRYIRVYAWDESCAEQAGQMRAELERRGTPIGPYDMLIAAHAKTLGATLVTHNRREFERVQGLQVVDWEQA